MIFEKKVIIYEERVEMMGEVLLKAEHVYKEFDATKALTDVSLELHRGEIRGLIGENGSGKSTFARIVTGIYPPTSGTMSYRGDSYQPKSVLDSRKHGIVLLAQESGTINSLTIAENMFLGEEFQFSKIGDVSLRKLKAETQRVLKENGIEGVNVRDKISKYSFEERKMIEVARAMENKPEILIVDETTTALSQSGRDRIYKIIKEQKEKDRCVLFISHDLDEVQRICDAVTVLRDGIYVDTLEKTEITVDKMRTLMVGREMSGTYYRADHECSYENEVVLSVDDVNYGNTLRDISLELHKGEILGLGGLTECGMHELCKIVFGAIKPTSGRVILKKGNTEIRSTATSIANKIAYFPKDRDQESLFQATSIRDNIVAASFAKLKKGFFIFPKDEKKLAAEKASELSVKMRGIDQMVSDLSGGNKQKVVVAKWLANDSEIMIMDCPTRGIDIGVKASIYRLMEQLKREGKSIIMVSEEMEELLGMSDRILIIKNGRINGEFKRSESLNQYAIIEKMV